MSMTGEKRIEYMSIRRCLLLGERKAEISERRLKQ